MELILLILLAALGAKHFVFPALRKAAWESSASRADEKDTKPPRTLTLGWTFTGTCTGWDQSGVYKAAVHWPVYLVVTFLGALRFPFEVLCEDLSRMINTFMQVYSAVYKTGKQLYSIRTDKISDERVFEMATATSLVLFGNFVTPDEYIFEMPKNAPATFLCFPNCHLPTLTVTFKIADDNTVTVMSASSQHGQVEGTDTVSRNEILVGALRSLLSDWCHPLIHVGAELSALEIQRKRVAELEPSSHFVSGLHEGLLHGPFSPLTPNQPFFCGTSSASDIYDRCIACPFPQHTLVAGKKQFPYFKFAIQGRAAIFRLVQKYELDISAENLFLNIIMHSCDHESCYQVLSKMPLWSIDGTGSLWSKWASFCFTHVWLRHKENPLHSDLLSANVNMPFYRDLYDALLQIDQDMAKRIVVSCSF